jgi:hypothetical protein
MPAMYTEWPLLMRVYTDIMLCILPSRQLQMLYDHMLWQLYWCLCLCSHDWPICSTGDQNVHEGANQVLSVLHSTLQDSVCCVTAQAQYNCCMLCSSIAVIRSTLTYSWLAIVLQTNEPASCIAQHRAHEHYIAYEVQQLQVLPLTL